ncbi:hypothetical protein BJ165DRAFT_1407609 [Panaeolus papilionaceus]|nr:hypothetical protein BJ165DRAFT_1407609 [Panaeolus papilionaceus]
MSGPPSGFPFPPGFTPTGPPPWFPTGLPSGRPGSSSTSSTHRSSSSESSLTPSTTSSSGDTSIQTNLPASDPQSQQSHKSSIIGPIVGGVIGALILLAVLLAWRGIVWVRRRKRQRLEEKVPSSPVRSTDLEAATTPRRNIGVTPYAYNPAEEIVSATTLTSSSAPPWPKKTAGYGIDSVLIAHNGADAETQSLARSASMWTADSKHTSTSMSSTIMNTPISPGGISLPTSDHTSVSRAEHNSRMSQNTAPLEVVLERPGVGEDIPPPYQQNAA